MNEIKEHHCLTGNEALAYCTKRGFHISFQELVLLFTRNKNIFRYSSKMGKNGMIVIQEELDEYFKHKESVNEL